MKVLGLWPSPFVMRPRIALNIKSVEYEMIEENLNPKSELLLKSNPVYKKIPVIIHNDKPVCESLIIVEYIDEAFPSGPSILPTDPHDRAIQRFWASYIDDKWFPRFHDVVQTQSEETRAAAIEEVKEGLVLLEDAFEKCSKGKPFFNGDTIGYLDIAFGCIVGWLHATGRMFNVVWLNQEKTPNLLAWAEKFCADDAVKDVMPEIEKLLEFAEIMKAKFQAEAANQS